MIERLSRSWLLVFSAFTLAASLTFFPVLKAELQNPVSFPVAFLPLALSFAGITIALTLLIVALESTARSRWRPAFVIANITLAMAAWLKGSVMVWDYGSLIASEPNWRDYRLQGAADVALCVGIAIGGALARRWMFSKAAEICSFLCLAQAFHMAWLSPAFSERTFADLFTKETLEIADKREEILSTTSNIVVIILDTFQSDVFADLLAQEPTLAQELPGFRYYTDATSRFPYTMLSIPSVLTGEDYRNQIPYPKYQYTAFDGPASVMKNLMESGYYVELDRWGLATPIPYRSMLASNLIRKFFPGFLTTASLQLFALYTIAPQFLKQQMFGLVRQVGIDATGTLDNNLTFIRDVLHLPSRLTEQPVAKIIHLKGPHLPFRRYERSGFDYFAAAKNDETASHDVAGTRENYTAVAGQSIRGVVGYLKRFQDAGVYDKSSVFVFGDHGAGLQGQTFIPPAAWNIEKREDVVGSALRVTALPLMIAKQAGATGPLQTMPAPVSLSDLNCTMLRLLPKHVNDDCYSLFDFKSPPPVLRLFYSTEVRLDPQGYLPPIKAFEIDGPAWKDTSWRALPIQLHSQNRLYRIPAYKTGDTINFGKGGTAYDYQTHGWGDAGDGFVWTVGRRADLTIPMSDKTSQPLMLTASLAPYVVPGRLESQTVNIYVNREKLATWIVSENGGFKAAIPSRLAASGRLDVRLDLPNATSPSALGLGSDGNQYGVQLSSLAIYPAVYKTGDVIGFGRSGNATEYQSGGWGSPGDGFTWTAGRRSSLALPLPGPSADPLMLEVALTPLLVPGQVEGQAVAVYANDEQIADWQASAPGTYRAAIPPRLTASGQIEFRFDVPGARSAAELGTGDDRSLLGVQVKSVALRPSTLQIGDSITFGREGNAIDFQSGGWNLPSDGFTWSFGGQADLVLPLPEGTTAAQTLQASLAPWLIPGRLDHQTVLVFANGEKIAEWIATESGLYKAPIPAGMIASGHLNIRFVFPDATSPALLGISADPALYAVQMRSIIVDNNPYVLGAAVTFGRDGSSRRFQAGGWGDPQAGFTWTVGNRSLLNMQLASIPKDPLTLEASLIPFVVPGKLDRQTVVVSVNNERITEWSVGAAGKYEATIPAGLLASGHLDLRFDLPDATSPATLGLNDDPTVFAVQVVSLALH